MVDCGESKGCLNSTEILEVGIPKAAIPTVPSPKTGIPKIGKTNTGTLPKTEIPKAGIPKMGRFRAPLMQTPLGLSLSCAFLFRACFKGFRHYSTTIAWLSSLIGLGWGGWELVPVCRCEIGRHRVSQSHSLSQRDPIAVEEVNRDSIAFNRLRGPLRQQCSRSEKALTTKAMRKSKLLERLPLKNYVTPRPLKTPFYGGGRMTGSYKNSCWGEASKDTGC